jgi:hypothetical protein
MVIDVAGGRTPPPKQKPRGPEPTGQQSGRRAAMRWLHCLLRWGMSRCTSLPVCLPRSSMSLKLGTTVRTSAPSVKRPVDEFDITIFGQTGTRLLEAARLRASLTGEQPDGNVRHDEAPARMRAGASSCLTLPSGCSPVKLARSRAASNSRVPVCPKIVISNSSTGRLTDGADVRTVVPNLSDMDDLGRQTGRLVQRLIPHLRRQCSQRMAALRPDCCPVGSGPRGFCLGGGVRPPATSMTITAVPARGRPLHIGTGSIVRSARSSRRSRWPLA